MQSDLDEFPIDPEEATDLKLHVRNCVKRHTALVRQISKFQTWRMRSEIVTWVYRSFVLPAIGWIIYKLWVG